MITHICTFLNMFKTRCVFINRNSVFRNSVQKGTNTNEIMMFKMFYLCGFVT